ncbi:hypothetical protein KEM54_001028 [Ascosphaera aggregata]|nr:hypothetical protein KEM54_001028 [Ascosphaera aggregata]
MSIFTTTQTQPASAATLAPPSDSASFMAYRVSAGSSNNSTAESFPIHTEPMRTAAQQALSLPEILSMIFAFNLDAGHLTSLRRCALVNSTWYHEAIKHLWSDPCSRKGSTIPKMLSEITDLETRQTYANLMRSGTLAAFWDWDKEQVEMSQTIFPGLQFRKLRNVTVHVRPFDERLPNIQGATTVQRVTVKSQYWDYSDGSYFQYVEKIGMGKILDQIPKVFPNTKVIIFRGSAEARRKHLDRLAHQLPKLKAMDSSELWIIES